MRFLAWLLLLPFAVMAWAFVLLGAAAFFGGLSGR